MPLRDRVNLPHSLTGGHGFPHLLSRTISWPPANRTPSNVLFSNVLLQPDVCGRA